MSQFLTLTLGGMKLEFCRFARYRQISREADSNSEINRLSGELCRRITQVMNALVSTVSSQIQNAISETIIEQLLPKIQATFTSGQGQVPRKGWNVPAEKKRCRSEEAFRRTFRISSRDEFLQNLIRDEDEEDTH